MQVDEKVHEGDEHGEEDEDEEEEATSESPLPSMPVPYLLCVSECGFRAYRTSFYSFSREEASTTEICQLTLAMQDWPICELPREYFRGRSLL